MRIGCIGVASDPTFRHTVMALAARGATPVVIDLVQTTLRGEYRYDFAAPEVLLLVQAGRGVAIDDLTPVYCRLVDTSAHAPTPQQRDRCLGLYWSMTRSLGMPRRAPLVNRPLADRTNSSKFAHQRAVASVAVRHGIAIVPTIVTNQPADARAFIATHQGHVISKGASAAKTIAANVTKEDLDRLDLAQKCPILLQTRIRGPDVRVHSIAGECVGELIVSDGVDYRFERANVRECKTNIELPSDVKLFVRDLHDLFGVAFLGVDFKIDADQLEWYFLEANSMPAYHGYDRRANGRISDLLACYLFRR